jgi:hypothetical protein
MIKELRTEHVHSFRTYRFKPLGTWAFIVQVCECKAESPVDYGPLEKMKEKFMSIKKRVEA